MERLLILGVFLLAAVGQDIQHAPTVAQCQAERRLWFSKLEENDSSGLPAWNVLSKWGSEMSDCEDVDADNQSKYSHVSSESTHNRVYVCWTLLTVIVCMNSLLPKMLRGSVKGAYRVYCRNGANIGKRLFTNSYISTRSLRSISIPSSLLPNLTSNGVGSGLTTM